MRKILCISAFLCTGMLAAQTPIQREVDVTRAYEPSVQNALKINRMPDMTDTVQTRPEFRYPALSRPIEAGFPVASLAPVRLAAIDRMVEQPFYLELGAGYPLRSVGDLRYTHVSDRLTFGAFATHTGRYDRIVNDMGIEESAAGTDNNAGLALDLRPAAGFSIDAEAGYRFRSVTRYGYYGSENDMAYYELSDDALKQFYHNPRARISLGSDPRDQRRVNARLGGGVDYFAERYRYDRLSWLADAAIGLRLGEGTLALDADLRVTRGMENLLGYKSTTAQGKLSYLFEKEEFKYGIGLGFAHWESVLYTGAETTGRSVFLPQFLLEKALFEGRLTPFFELRSSIESNTFSSLMLRNPYVFSGTRASKTVAYRGRIGARGTLGHTFRYKAYLGYDRLDNAVYWVNTQEYSSFGNAFSTLSDDLTAYRGGVEMQVNILDVITLRAAASGARYDSKNFESPGGLPELTIEGGVGYNHRNRLYIDLGMELIGERTMYERRRGALTTHLLPQQIDLRASVEYRATPRLGVFVRMNNLLDHDLYVFNRYREPGIGGTLGVRISF